MVDNISFPCNECDAIFDSKLSLSLHRRKHTNAKSTNVCNICGKKTKSSTGLKAHVASHSKHHVIADKTCTLCGKSKTRLVHGTLCMSCYKKSMQIEKQCIQCGKTIHVMPNAKNLVCLQCRRSNVAMDVVCPDCNKHFNGSRQGQRCQGCQVKCNRQSTEQFVCPRCNRVKSIKLRRGDACSDCVRMDSLRSNNAEKYGVEYTFQVKSVKDTIKSTLLERYGVDHSSRIGTVSDTISERNMLRTAEKYGCNPQVVNTKQGLLSIIDSMDYPTVYNMCEATGLDYQCMLMRIHKFGLEDAIHLSATHNTYPEQRWAVLLDEHGMQFQREQRIYGDGRRCDFVNYEYRIGIEVNPSYTHSTYGGNILKPVDRMYHFDRSKSAEANGWNVLHVWDWLDAEKVLTFLQSKMHMDANKVSAHKCNVVELSQKQANMFCEAYHLQGAARNGQQKCYGLVHDGELVMVATYGKPRYNSNYDWEFIRSCTKAGWHVQGGISKLQKHFVKDARPKSLITYTDFSRSCGQSDESIGMDFVGYTGPSLVWWNGKRTVRDTSLLKVGADAVLGTHYGSKDICGMDNHDIMVKEGYNGIYDCGNKTYELHLN